MAMQWMDKSDGLVQWSQKPSLDRHMMESKSGCL